MRLRPGLIGDYQSDAAIFRSVTQRTWFVVLLALAIYLGLGGRFLFLHLSADLLLLAVSALFASIAAIGLNIVTGMAGQISLGHAFFLGLGAYTAAALGGAEKLNVVTGEATLVGLGLDMIIWVPAAGLVAALAGLIVAPVATRVRGLYLAFVTLGLVFLGEHLFKELEMITGGAGRGRDTAIPSLFGFRFDQPGSVLGVHLTAAQKWYFLGLGLLIVFGVTAKNLARSRVGRAMAAVRDRDIAAEIMGIPLARYKTIAFVVSSFYAGVAGALLYGVIGFLEPSKFGFGLSIEYIAMVLIGGIATVSGSIMGALFIVFLPRGVERLAGVDPNLLRYGGGLLVALGLALFAAGTFGGRQRRFDLAAGLVTIGGLLLLSDLVSASAAGGVLTIEQFERILFGVFIIGFLIFEPLGLYGIWIRVRNYWKAWPFSY